MIQRALEAVTGGIERLADELGVNYNTVWSWKQGRRNPSADNLRRLADVLDRRADQLHQLAEQIREAADSQG